MSTVFLAQFIQLLFTILTWAIIIRILLSWVRINTSNPVVYRLMEILYQITEPILAPARQIIPPMGGMDFSPIIVLILLSLLERFLLSLLF
ncbi:MAG: YggT family protein [Chloroflexi bacterium]|nr:YggT family protein [Chloroflexota bacterium]